MITQKVIISSPESSQNAGCNIFCIHVILLLSRLFHYFCSMEEMTTQLITAVSLSDDKGLDKDRQYLFSLQVSKEGVIRIITTDDIEVYYGSIHDFLINWQKISSLGWANDKATFARMLDDLKGQQS